MAFVAYSTKTSIEYIMNLEQDEFLTWYDAVLKIHEIYNPKPKGNG